MLLVLNIMFIVVAVVVIGGIWMIWPPLALVIGGAGLMTLTLVLASAWTGPSEPTTSTPKQRQDVAVISTKDEGDDG